MVATHGLLGGPFQSVAIFDKIITQARPLKDLKGFFGLVPQRELGLRLATSPTPPPPTPPAAMAMCRSSNQPLLSGDHVQRWRGEDGFLAHRKLFFLAATEKFDLLKHIRKKVPSC